MSRAVKNLGSPFTGMPAASLQSAVVCDRQETSEVQQCAGARVPESQAGVRIHPGGWVSWAEGLRRPISEWFPVAGAPPFPPQGPSSSLGSRVM